MRLWIDTDVGENPDDAVALLCAAAHPGIELVGVSTVGADPARRAEVATAILAAAASDPFVYAGVSDPRALEFAEAVLAIGPLTNVAALVESGIALAPLAVMGGIRGTVWHRGAWREEERNFSSDPVAAATVVRSAPDLLVVPLDVTARMVLTPAELDLLLVAAPILEPSVRRFLEWQASQGSAGHERAICLHDPLALLALLGERCVQVEPTPLRVGPTGRLEAGDRYVDCVVDVDRDAAVGLVLELVAQARRPSGSTPPAR